MPLDPWLPVGHNLANGVSIHTVAYGDINWQIYETSEGGKALVARYELFSRWREVGLIQEGFGNSIEFGPHRFWTLSCRVDQGLWPVTEAKGPENKSEALSFALALKATRDIDAESPLQDSLYIEKISRLLPTYSITQRTDDDIVLGYWLTGGLEVSAKSFRRLRQTIGWLDLEHLQDVIQAAGFEAAELLPLGRFQKPSKKQKAEEDRAGDAQKPSIEEPRSLVFELAGRPELAVFFNEHIIDIIQNRERYKTLGINFPSAIVLHGPPGCGKTFAVERLIDFLGWPSFQIEASSVASPYIHETSKKIAEVFDQAIADSPSVLVIDEAEAFLADRASGSGHHRVEEVAEFLRRIPEATRSDVLIVAMTNRVDMIDPAILRRGRFDHVISVDYASGIEVLALLEKLLSALPKDDDVDPTPFAEHLAGRPLSDVTFVVREAARRAAHLGKDKLDQEVLLATLKSVPAREREGGKRHPIGFIH
jgi:cell division protease FtsH